MRQAAWVLVVSVSTLNEWDMGFDDELNAVEERSNWVEATRPVFKRRQLKQCASELMSLQLATATITARSGDSRNWPRTAFKQCQVLRLAISGTIGMQGEFTELYYFCTKPLNRVFLLCYRVYFILFFYGPF